MGECLFCRIIAGELPCEKVFENQNVFAFKDIHPHAKVHCLFVHKTHTSNVSEMVPNDIGELFLAIREWVSGRDDLKEGYRITTNTGPMAGQTVFHTHFHVLGGEFLSGQKFSKL